MSDRNFEEQDEIQRILGESSRLRYVLSTHHGVALDAVTSLRVDGDNAKIDVWVGERMMRFKAKGTQRVSPPEERASQGGSCEQPQRAPRQEPEAVSKKQADEVCDSDEPRGFDAIQALRA